MPRDKLKYISTLACQKVGFTGKFTYSCELVGHSIGLSEHHPKGEVKLFVSEEAKKYWHKNLSGLRKSGFSEEISRLGRVMGGEGSRIT